MTEGKADYQYMIEIAKLNLADILNNKMREYRKKPTMEIKKEIINLMKERKQLFLFDTSIIEKYI